MATMILLRHGQSVWNAANKFTGWTDVELSEVGEAEAAKAGEDLAEIEIDVVHTSDLIRAQRTAAIVMNTIGSQVMSRPIETSDSMSDIMEHCRVLTKMKTRAKYGEEQVHIWRRSYDIPHPKVRVWPCVLSEHCRTSMKRLYLIWRMGKRFLSRHTGTVYEASS